MPVGVPKVPFLIPGDEEASWVDLYNRVSRQRTIFFCDELDDELADKILNLLIILTIEDPITEIFLFINSPGGLILNGAAIFDLMHTVTPEVITVAMCEASSTASFVLVGGEITKRLAFPHARVMIHQPASDLSKKKRATKLIMEAYELLRLRDTITKAYAQRTGKPYWVLVEDMERDTFMSAIEARDHGIVDLVGIEDYKS